MNTTVGEDLKHLMAKKSVGKKSKRPKFKFDKKLLAALSNKPKTT
jgi:hypothetical protein